MKFKRDREEEEKEEGDANKTERKAREGIKILGKIIGKCCNFLMT